MLLEVVYLPAGLIALIPGLMLIPALGASFRLVKKYKNEKTESWPTIMVGVSILNIALLSYS